MGCGGPALARRPRTAMPPHRRGRRIRVVSFDHLARAASRGPARRSLITRKRLRGHAYSARSIASPSANGPALALLAHFPRPAYDGLPPHSFRTRTEGSGVPSMLVISVLSSARSAEPRCNGAESSVSERLRPISITPTTKLAHPFECLRSGGEPLTDSFPISSSIKQITSRAGSADGLQLPV